MKPVKAVKTASRKKATSLNPVATTEAPTKTVKLEATASARSVKPVMIEAKIDVGFGNSLYLRGEGTGLSWDQGIPLTCVDGSTWKWSTEASDKLKFKLLLNDAIWAAGEDLVAAPGQTLEVSPRFS